MKILNEAFKTIDEKIFEDKKDAELHESNLLLKKDLAKLLHRWYGYNGMIEDFYFVAENMMKDKDKVVEILGE